MKSAEEIVDLKGKRDALDSLFGSGISEAREISIRNQIASIDNRIAATKNMEVAVLQDPWAWNNVSYASLSTVTFGAMAYGGSMALHLSKEGRLLSTVGGLWFGFWYGENGRRKRGL